MAREFHASKAVRSKVPLLVGIYGPSGSGKTFSALRLATGIQRVVPGRIVVLDTEAKRALHYASDFDFDHVPFNPPFSPDDYGAALRYCTTLNPSVVVIDSGSHMHEGPGGILEMHANELAAKGGGDKHNFAAWIKPKRQLTAFVQELLRMGINTVWCFRAKEKLKIIPGKNPEPLGWLPIMPDELPYEMTVNALLEPGANGVPQWKPAGHGAELMVKLPRHFRDLLTTGKPFDEGMGEALARWAAGDAAAEVLKFVTNWPSQRFAGMALADATPAIVLEYIEWLDGMLKATTKPEAVRVITTKLAQAQRHYDERMAQELGGDHAETTEAG